MLGTTDTIDGVKPAEFRAMDRTGDGLKLTWRHDRPREVEVARQTFNDYQRRGFDLFRLGEGDERGAAMTDFDPHASGILAVPRMVGG